MPWSRIDSGFWHHPKFNGWTAAQKWALGELFGYCCEYRTEGRIPTDFNLLPRSITKGFLELAERSGWIDRDKSGCMVIHDWHVYHPKDATAADRQRRRRVRDSHDSDRDISVTEPVTTNTSTNTKDQRPLSSTEKKGGDERTGRVRDAETNKDGLERSTGEDHGSVFHLERVEPEGREPADVLELRAFIQDQLGA